MLDSAVVGAPVAGHRTAERVQAVLLLAPGTDADLVVRDANARLGDHQKIRAAAVWPGTELPRTEGTRKLKRRELRAWLVGQQSPAGPSAAEAGSHADVPAILARFAPGRTIEPTTTIDELGLSSLERVELMMALEEAFQVTVDEGGVHGRRDRRGSGSLIAPVEWGPPASDRRRDSGGPSRVRPPGLPLGSTAGDLIFPSWNRIAAGAGGAAREPADVDPPARPDLRAA